MDLKAISPLFTTSSSMGKRKRNTTLDAGATLNAEKCEFSKKEVKFAGYFLNEEGIRSNPEKTESIQDMDTPQNVSGVRRFLGMVNQLGKFVPHLAEKNQANQGSSEHEERIPLGTDPARRLWEAKKRTNFKPSAYTLWSCQKNNPVGRCFIIWTPHSAPTTTRKCSKQTSNGCVKIHDKYRAKVCSNRKRSSCDDLGVPEV